ncbi:MAG: GYDIA family GHMP kinase [Saprospiraceae bacterium]
MMKKYYGHGKLLLTGEYFVLDGAKALAFPTKQGQRMEVASTSGPEEIEWEALDQKGTAWLQARFSKLDFALLETNDHETASRLGAMLQACRDLNPLFEKNTGLTKVQTFLEFPREWGLGTSSTLIFMLSQWSETNPWEVLRMTMGGSGYDLACAGASGPGLYEIKNGEPSYRLIDFKENIFEKAVFVYSGNKQNSREGIKQYRSNGKPPLNILQSVSKITDDLIHAVSVEKVISLLKTHENIVGEYLKLQPLFEREYSDFDGVVKSLGAWGGDFFMALSKDGNPDAAEDYFKKKGFTTILKYKDLAL